MATSTFRYFKGGFANDDNATVSNVLTLSLPQWFRIVDLKVSLIDLTHTFPDDLDFLLLGPDERGFEFWSDAGGSTDIVNADFGITDSAASLLPTSGGSPKTSTGLRTIPR
jgi:hypothetical protein